MNVRAETPLWRFLIVPHLRRVGVRGVGLGRHDLVAQFRGSKHEGMMQTTDVVVSIRRSQHQLHYHDRNIGSLSAAKCVREVCRGPEIFWLSQKSDWSRGRRSRYTLLGTSASGNSIKRPKMDTSALSPCINIGLRSAPFHSPQRSSQGFAASRLGLGGTILV
jgi:hypothetical protein